MKARQEDWTGLPVAYDPDQLRTFLAVAQSLSFTQAAERLGIRQPTVSQHIRKLETAVGRPLFVRDTRTVTLTADGEAMAGFARTILAAHEEAVGYFTGSELRGRLRFGVTDDLALTPLPRILRDFRQLYPRIDLELTVAQSPNLLRRVESGHLDLAYVKHTVGASSEPTWPAGTPRPAGLGRHLGHPDRARRPRPARGLPGTQPQPLPRRTDSGTGRPLLPDHLHRARRQRRTGRGPGRPRHRDLRPQPDARRPRRTAPELRPPRTTRRSTWS